MDTNEITFGEYIKSIRTSKKKSLRETAKAIGVSPQFYSEVENNHRCAFTANRLESLKDFLNMSTEETEKMYTYAAQTRKNITVPQDIADYIVKYEYVMLALRQIKKMKADKNDWEKIVDDFITRKTTHIGIHNIEEK